MASDEDSSGMLSRVNKISARIVRISTAIPWASGVMSCNTCNRWSHWPSPIQAMTLNRILVHTCLATTKAPFLQRTIADKRSYKPLK